MKKIIISFFVFAFVAQGFALEKRMIETISIVEGEEGIVVLNDATIWEWSPSFEGEERAVGWEKGDEVLIAPFLEKGALYLTLFNLTKEMAPEEKEVNGNIYYIQPQVAPIFIFSKGGNGLHRIADIQKDAGWIYTDLLITMSNGTNFKADSGKFKQPWEVGDQILMTQLEGSEKLQVVNMSKSEIFVITPQ